MKAIMCTKNDAFEGMTIEWNGSATFNIYVDGRNVDVFTRYGDDEGGPCSPQQAYEAMEDRWQEMIEEG